MKNQNLKKYILAGITVLAVAGIFGYLSSDKSELKGEYRQEKNYYQSVRTNPRWTLECYPQIAFRIEHLAEDQDFTDTDDSRYYDEIAFLGEMGVLDGDNNEFNPEDNISREEFLRIVMLSSGREIEEGSYDDQFSDVDEDDENADLIATAVEDEIVKGYSNGTFKPNAKITYAQASKMATKAVACGYFDEQFDDYNVDSSSNNPWYEGYDKMLNAMDVWSAAPDHYLTKEEAAKFVYDIMEGVLADYDISMRVFDRD